MLQVSDNAARTAVEEAKTIDGTNFRVAPANPETAERAKRLREAVRGAGGNKAIVASSGVPNSTLSDYLAAKEWKFATAVSLAEACRVSLDWLATGHRVAPWATPPASIEVTPGGDVEGEAFTLRVSHDGDGSRLSKFIDIPRYDVQAAAGPGNEIVSEQLDGSVALEEGFFRQNLGSKREDVVTITADGDSMDPTIRDGDLLFVDTSVHDIDNSRIYVLEVNGRLLVKRVQLRLDGSLVIKSDNPRYDPEVVVPSERDPLRIIGRVVYQAGPVRS